MTDKNILKNILDGLVSSFEDDVRNKESYKGLFEKFDGVSYKRFLRDLEHKMESLALDACQVIEDKTGRIMTREQIDILYALPFLAHRLEKEIIKDSGLSCCVDKAFHLLDKHMRDNER